MITCFNDRVGEYTSLSEANKILDAYIAATARYFNRELTHIRGISSKRFQIASGIEKLRAHLNAISESKKFIFISKYLNNVDLAKIKEITDNIDCAIMEINMELMYSAQMDEVEDMRRG